MTIDLTRFHDLADRTLDRIMAEVDRELGDELDVEIHHEILTIDLPGGGQYVLNKNAHLGQLWLSSPKSGAWHFEWDQAAGDWRSTRGGEVHLGSLLAGELTALTGVEIGF